MTRDNDLVTHIDVGLEFSQNITIISREHSEFSAERFLDEVLRPAYVRSGRVVVNFNNVEKYSSHFLSHVFGNLAVEFGYDHTMEHIGFVSPFLHLPAMIRGWMQYHTKYYKVNP